MRSRWLGAVVVLAVLTAVVLQARVVSRAGFFVGDFRAFYCAARVASHGADPYHAEPLRACEMSVGSARFFEKNPGVVIPAPLPGYVLAALVPFSLFPFGIATALWLGLLLAAWAAAIVTLMRFAALRWDAALSVFSLSFGVISLPFGEVVPLAVAFICMAAFFAQHDRWGAAALCAAGAMVEPHLGLPVALALAIWAPRSRVLVILCIAALGVISLLMLGAGANVEYFTSVLPSHALSEATRDTQYSLTAVLAALGVPAAVAVKAGALWYLAMLAIGVVIAGRLAKQSGNGAFIACIPPAFAVFGGTFIHVTQIAAALPAAALLVCHQCHPEPACPERSRREGRHWTRAGVLGVGILLVLAVPWGWIVSPALLVAPLVPVGYLAWYYWSENAAGALIAAIAAALLMFGLQESYTVTGSHLSVVSAAPAIDARLAEASWSTYSRSGSNASLAAWAVRIPTWTALALLLVVTVREATQRVTLSRVTLSGVEG